MAQRSGYREDEKASSGLAFLSFEPNGWRVEGKQREAEVMGRGLPQRDESTPRPTTSPKAISASTRSRMRVFGIVSAKIRSAVTIRNARDDLFASDCRNIAPHYKSAEGAR